jgi:ABC-type uncharacterized transport system fused permease/ATPase subunit
MRDKAYYKCDKDDSKGNPDWKICEDIAKCLKDPLSYKSQLAQKQWRQFMEDLEFYYDFVKNNFLWIGFTIVLGAFCRYLQMDMG